MTSVTNGPPAAPPGAAPQQKGPAVPPPRPRLRRSRAPVQGSPEGLPLRRRWGRFAAGAILALLGAWVFASLYISAGERKEVLAVARDVPRFQEIERDDLRTVRVAADPGVDTVSAGEADEIVGRIASTGLREGSLLSESQIFPEDTRPIEEDQRRVPLALDQDIAPQGRLDSGTEVDVVIFPPENPATPEEEAARTVPGWLYSVGELDEERRTRPVEVVVDSFAADDVAAAAHADRVMVLLGPGEG
jgi:hypothetical protein